MPSVNPVPALPNHIRLNVNICRDMDMPLRSLAALVLRLNALVEAEMALSSTGQSKLRIRVSLKTSLAKRRIGRGRFCRTKAARNLSPPTRTCLWFQGGDAPEDQTASEKT